MATTTNFGWTTPDNTALVKDGASAIRTLGSSIDTSFVDLKGGTTGQVLKKTSATDLDFEWGTASLGLTLISTTSFAAVASQSFNNVFSATYDNYQIIVTNLTNSTNGNIQFRMRVGGVDASGANTYKYQGFYSDGGTLGNESYNTTQWGLSIANTTPTGMIDFSLYEPFLARATKMKSMAWDAPSEQTLVYTGIHTPTTSYDGFTILPTAGNVTGTISIFGVAK